MIHLLLILIIVPAALTMIYWQFKYLVALLLLISSFSFANETRTKIAVIDTGISFEATKLKQLRPFLCKTGHKDFTGQGIKDTHGHGTNMVSLIIKDLNPKKYCIIIVKYYLPDYQNLAREIKALEHCLKIGVHYINFSSAGWDADKSERNILVRLLKKGTKISVAAGNNGQDLTKKCDVYPACYNFGKNFYVVGNCKDGKYKPSSNYGTPPVTHCEDGKATSEATAMFTGKLINVR